MKRENPHRRGTPKVIRLKRVYEPPDPSDGNRILVDRLWPRGIGKDTARIDAWRKDLSPTNALRRWYDHDPRKWEEFKRRYRNELSAAGKTGDLEELRRHAGKETVTLLFGSRERMRNNAAALKEFLEEGS